jgi:hypothetical protein
MRLATDAVARFVPRDYRPRSEAAARGTFNAGDAVGEQQLAARAAITGEGRLCNGQQGQHGGRERSNHAAHFAQNLPNLG